MKMIIQKLFEMKSDLTNNSDNFQVYYNTLGIYSYSFFSPVYIYLLHLKVRHFTRSFYIKDILKSKI